VLFFFYGTLMDESLRSALAGARASRLRVASGVLPDHDRRAARDGPYPVLVPAPGRRVPGLLVAGVDRHLALWIAHFEGSGYRPAAYRVLDATGRRQMAVTFAPTVALPASAHPWSLARWQRQHKAPVARSLALWLRQLPGGQPLSLDVTWQVRRRLDALQHTVPDVALPPAAGGTAPRLIPPRRAAPPEADGPVPTGRSQSPERRR